MTISELNKIIVDVNEGLAFLETEIEINPGFDGILDKTSISNAYRHADHLLAEIKLNGCNRNDIHLVNQLANSELLNPNHFTLAKSAMGQDIALESISKVIGKAFDSLSELLKKIWEGIIKLVTVVFNKTQEVSLKAINYFKKVLSKSDHIVKDMPLMLDKTKHVDLIKYGVSCHLLLDIIDSMVGYTGKFVDILDLYLATVRGSENVHELKNRLSITAKQYDEFVDRSKSTFLKPKNLLDQFTQGSIAKKKKITAADLSSEWAKYKEKGNLISNSPLIQKIVGFEDLDFFKTKEVKKLDITELQEGLDEAVSAVEWLQVSKIKIKDKYLHEDIRHDLKKIKDRLIEGSKIFQVYLIMLTDLVKWQSEIRILVVSGSAKIAKEISIAKQIITALGGFENIDSVKTENKKIIIRVKDVLNLDLKSLRLKNTFSEEDLLISIITDESESIAKMITYLRGSN